MFQKCVYSLSKERGEFTNSFKIFLLKVRVLKLKYHSPCARLPQHFASWADTSVLLIFHMGRKKHYESLSVLPKHKHDDPWKSYMCTPWHKEIPEWLWFTRISYLTKSLPLQIPKERAECPSHRRSGLAPYSNKSLTTAHDTWKQPWKSNLPKKLLKVM